MVASNRVHPRILDWAGRYLPAELASLALTLPTIWISLALTNNIMVSALVGTWTENLVYYGTMAWRSRPASRLTLAALLRLIGALMLEFGPAEALDSFLIRPAALLLAMTLLPQPALGAVVGKLIADIVFYLPTIVSYELLRRGRGSMEES